MACVGVWAQGNTFTVSHFDKIVVSPHIQATFVEGNNEQVQIVSNTVSNDKVNVEVNGKTLRIYLDGAKEVTKNEKIREGGYKRSKSIYNGTVLIVTITYKDLKELWLRGEEKFICESPLKGNRFRLKIYGESQVYLNEVDLDELHTTIYGESFLEIKKGQVSTQKFTAYGETKINTLGVANKFTKIIAYGEGSYRVNVSDRLKVTAYGEATVAYEGNPEIDKGIVIGEATIQKIQ
jgi:hypothetical protein